MALAIADLPGARQWWGLNRREVVAAPRSGMYRIDLAGAPSVVLQAQRLRVSGRDLLLENWSRRKWTRSRVFTLSTIEQVSRREVHGDGGTTWRTLDLLASHPS